MGYYRSFITKLLDQALVQLFPGYFSVVMATGATSIASHLLGYVAMAQLLLLCNILAYVVLWLLTLARLCRYPSYLVSDMVDHVRGPGFFTIIAATSILGSQFHIVLEADGLALGLWGLAVILWFLVMYTFFIAITTRQQKPNLEDGINGAWLLAAVSTHSVAVLTGLLPWPEPAADVMLFFALSMYLIGCMLYMAIITLIFYRLTFLRVTTDSLTPPYWINMGAVAIATLAGSTLIVRADTGVLAGFLPFLKGFTVFFWATSTWWIPLLIGLMIWRHLIRRHPLTYEPQLWSMVFPLAMYTTGTLMLAAALDIPFLAYIPQYLVWLALTGWLFASLSMALHFHRAIVAQLQSCRRPGLK